MLYLKKNQGDFNMSSYKIEKTVGDTSWLIHDRFGMFIHFGTYSLAARHEWIKTMEKIPEEKYNKYFEYFNPDMFDAKEWARKAKNAGMKYAILTTKHHEGFCLFDSKYTDYCVTNTPFKRDIVKEYVEAFRAEGLKIGLYYSVIDWHHPHFPIDGIHPRRDDVDAEAQDKGRDARIYAEYMRNQVTELLTNYGKIDVLWYDFEYSEPDYVRFLAFDKGNPPPRPEPLPWMQHGGVKSPDVLESEKLMALTRSLQPGIIVNNRLGIPGDTYTPEQTTLTDWPENENGEKKVWEGCHTFSGSWGYFRDETTWKTPKTLIDLLVKAVAFGGNLLMNVGPTSRGYFDHRADDALKVYENWMKYNSRSIYGCIMAEPEFTAPNGTLLTQSEDGKRLYVHILDYPFKKLHFEGILDKIDYVQFLNDGSEILYTEDNKGGVYFELPVKPPFEINPVIEIFLK